MKKPSIQFYPDNFLGGVAFMSMEERGIYITLLCYQALRGNIPKKRLGLLVGFDWVNLPDSIKEKFEQNDNEEIFNERMVHEIEKRAAFVEKQKENGKKGGRPRKNEKPKKNPDHNPNDNPELNPNESLYDTDTESENKSDIIHEGYTDAAELFEAMKAHGIKLDTYTIKHGRAKVLEELEKYTNWLIFKDFADHKKIPRYWAGFSNWMINSDNYKKQRETQQSTGPVIRKTV